MYKTEQWIQSSVLLLALTSFSVTTSKQPYIMLLFCGVLMILWTIRSLSENQNWLFLLLQMGVSIAFILFSGNPITYCILYECRILPIIQIVLPAILYTMVQLLFPSQTIAQTLLIGMLLFLVTAFLAFAERLLVGYVSAREKFSKALSINALGELYEKKRGQELVIKNYLADKNARLEERETISRNIHNNVGHSITAAIMALDAADMLFEGSPEKAREKMNVANERIRGSLESIRHAVRVLDNENARVSLGDLICEITDIVHNFMNDTNVHIRTDFPSENVDLQIPHEHTEFLTGAVQELLTNGVRHGKADVFLIHLTTDSRHIMLRVSNNGRSDSSLESLEERIKNGFGLKKLISYTKRCGGSAEFHNQNGFVSEITLPLYEEEEKYAKESNAGG